MLKLGDQEGPEQETGSPYPQPVPTSSQIAWGTGLHGCPCLMEPKHKKRILHPESSLSEAFLSCETDQMSFSYNLSVAGFTLSDSNIKPSVESLNFLQKPREKEDKETMVSRAPGRDYRCLMVVPLPSMLWGHSPELKKNLRGETMFCGTVKGSLIPS